MIDCPICHVKNNDDARFCAECGQRLTVQGGAPSLSEPAQSLGSWGQPAPQPAPQPGPQGGPPPAAPLPAPQDQGGGARPKLKSPLLSGDEDYGSGAPSGSQQYGGQGSDDVGANRLRQMSQNPPKQQDSGVDPNRPFKNPYDPRNANPPESPPESAPPQGGRKLRSPLLSAEEFDDSDFAEQDPPPANVRGGGLRSPLLGGGEGGGGGSRLPSRGGRQGAYEDLDDESHSGAGGHLRSPLLGGGGNDYGGPERRRAEDAQYGGTDRRKGGLRSPILGGAGGGEYYDDYEEEPIDEDDPTVLRSPLLAARRPVSDRPRKDQMPANSNTMNPPPAGQMPDIGRNLPNPSNSYTSLRSVRNAAPQGPMPAPSSVPPVPTEPVPQGYPQQYPQQYQQRPPQQPGYQQGVLPHQQPYGGQPQQPLAPMQAGPQGQPPQPMSQPAPQPGPGAQPSSMPTNVPPSFSNTYTERRPIAEPSAPVPTAQPVRPDDLSKFNKAAERSTESGINVQAPTSGTQPIIGEKSPIDGPSRNVTRKRSGLLAGGGYEDDEDAGGGYSPQFSHHSAPAGPASPIPKIIGVIAMLMFLVKAFSFVTGFMASDWKQYGWLMMDQIAMLITFLCVAVLAFTRKD